MGEPFTFKSFAKKIQNEHGGDPVAAALDIVVFQGVAPGNLDSEVESFRKVLAALGYQIVSEREYLSEVADKIHSLAYEAEFRAREVAQVESE